MHLLQVDMQIVTKNDYGCAKIMIPDAKGRVTILKSQSNPLNFVIRVQIYKNLNTRHAFIFRTHFNSFVDLGQHAAQTV